MILYGKVLWDGGMVLLIATISGGERRRIDLVEK